MFIFPYKAAYYCARLSESDIQRETNYRLCAAQWLFGSVMTGYMLQVESHPRTAWRHVMGQQAAGVCGEHNATLHCRQ